MALKGTLKDFSVADIFQLIGQQQKSGSLFVTEKEREAQIVFDAGKVVLAAFKRGEEDLLLGNLFLRAGVIDSGQLEKALRRQRETQKSLGDILIGMNAIASSTLSEFITLQLKEVLFRIFRWKDGFYEFVPEQIKYNSSVIRPQAAETILMDCFRMLDEWPSVSAKIGGFENVFRSLVDVTELTQDTESSDLDEGEEEEGKLSKSQKKILKLLDGHRTLQEVIDLCKQGTFDTCRHLATLSDRSLVLKVDHATIKRTQKAIQGYPETFGTWLTQSSRPLLLFFILCVLIPLVTFGFHSHWAHRFPHYDSIKGRSYDPSISLQEFYDFNRKEYLLNLVEFYHFERGEYPNSLNQVSKEPFLEKWEYRKEGDVFSLKLRY